MMKLRVLVVEDSLTIRKYLVDALAADPEIEVVAEAEDGQRAIELCETLRPDVVSMDMMLPVMDGLAATEHIMAYCPTPILIVSASFNRGEVFKTYDALSAGAVDALEKPTSTEPAIQWEQNYRQTLKTVARIKVITHPRARMARRQWPTPFKSAAGQFRCVAIGASTGGPSAVVSILKSLPADFPLPILLVIHIGPGFGMALTDWLNTVSPIRVRNAADGELLPPPGVPGVISVAPDRHLVVRDGRLRATYDPERHFCRPSVDVLFESLAREMGGSVIACLLTGMGKDGAEGLSAIRRAGGMTIAQDEESCVVFGMPREAVRLNAARQVLGLEEIAPALLQLARPQPTPQRITP
ncbi:MAG: chemotaxis-specific protein-glutamate methyltransferase CheB [Verrucomicrobia bacterium]|nr:chemotaxis-specific protein-glutamate methyltransferase CheB [Verrucomicrobiota bacterium]